MRLDRRLAIMFAFGFAAGLPLALTGFTLRQWLTESGLSLEVIGATASIGFAYTLKFLWAPALDHLRAPFGMARFGRRRGWLFVVQPLLVVAGLLLAFSSPVHNLWGTMAAAATLAFLSATQDIVIDAWRIEIFAPREQGAAMPCYVWGYRMAVLISGAGAVALVSAAGGDWSLVLTVMAVLMGIGLIPTLFAAEPEVAPVPQSGKPAGGFETAVLGPLLEFLTRPGAGAILAFVLLYRLGEALAGVMAVPLYNMLGYDRAAIALANGPVSMWATLMGALAGGYLVVRIGVGRALVLTGLGQMLSNIMYVVLIWSRGDYSVLMAQAMIEAFTDGMADAAFIAYLSGLTSVAFTATQYALLSSLAAVALRTVGGASGVMAAAMGWTAFYTMTILAALPAMGIMLYLLRRFPPQDTRKPRE